MINDPHLAESIGFGSGRRRGQAEGYNAGWDEAVGQANLIIAEKDRQLANLAAEIDKGNQWLG